MSDELSLQKLCEDCGHKCCTETGAAMVMEQEVERIRHYLSEHNLSDGLERIDGSDHFMIPRPDGPCPYFTGSGCGIQDVKPLDCKIFPYYHDLDGTLVQDNVCPATPHLPKEFRSEARKRIVELPVLQQRELARFQHGEGYRGTPVDD